MSTEGSESDVAGSESSSAHESIESDIVDQVSTNSSDSEPSKRSTKKKKTRKHRAKSSSAESEDERIEIPVEETSKGEEKEKPKRAIPSKWREELTESQPTEKKLERGVVLILKRQKKSNAVASNCFSAFDGLLGVGLMIAALIMPITYGPLSAATVGVCVSLAVLVFLFCVSGAFIRTWLKHRQLDDSGKPTREVLAIDADKQLLFYKSSSHLRFSLPLRFIKLRTLSGISQVNISLKTETRGPSLSKKLRRRVDKTSLSLPGGIAFYVDRPHLPITSADRTLVSLKRINASSAPVVTKTRAEIFSYVDALIRTLALELPPKEPNDNDRGGDVEGEDAMSAGSFGGSEDVSWSFSMSMGSIGGSGGSGGASGSMGGS